MLEKSPEYPPLPPDDLQRSLTIARPDVDQTLPHIGLVGDTYTVTVSGNETNGRFCVIDMHIPPGGGPPPHRHDFEETFILLEGEIEATLACPIFCTSWIVSVAQRVLSISLRRRGCGEVGSVLCFPLLHTLF